MFYTTGYKAHRFNRPLPHSMTISLKLLRPHREHEPRDLLKVIPLLNPKILKIVGVG